MTTQNIEIAVTAKVEDALKKIRKVVPTVSKSVEEVKQNLQKIDMNAVTNKVGQTIQSIKKKYESLKNYNYENEIKISANNKEAENQISQVQKQIDSLQEKVNARQMELFGQAFSNVLSYNGTGGVVVENLTTSFDNLFNSINNVVQSKGFEDFLNNCSDKFRIISEKLASIDWQPIVDALVQIGTNVGATALDILNGLIDIFKWLVENPIISEIIIAIAIAIGVIASAVTILNTAMTIYDAVMQAATLVSKTFGISISWLVAIVLGVIAIIALVILAIMNWDTIMNFLKQTVETVINAVVGFFTNLWEKVSFVFEAIWNIVYPILNAIWQVISTVFQAIWTIISTIITSVWNIFSQVFNWIWQLISKVFEGIWNTISSIINKIGETIKFALGKIQEIWSSIWNTISSVVNKVWNGIWSCIKKVINSILGGIESFVNGAIKGINFLLSGISKVANAIGSLIGLDPINLKISYVSLPRLAKGNIAYSETIGIFGEYAGASNNPEITTPQNIMRETFTDVLADYQFNSTNSSNRELKQLVFQFGSYKVAMEMENLLKQARRQNGIATVTV